MQLNLDDDQLLQDPDDALIRSAVARLSNEQFAILSRADEDYVQVFRTGLNEFQLEYRAGSEDEHYGATTTDFSARQIQDVFSAYASGAADWHVAWSWEKLDI